MACFASIAVNPQTKDEAIELATGIVESIESSSPSVGIFVPFPFIEAVQNVVGDKAIVGAQVSLNGRRSYL